MADLATVQKQSSIKPSATPMTLAFVNVTHPSRIKQHSTRIRRHVMKNIGFARRGQTKTTNPKAEPVTTAVEHGPSKEQPIPAPLYAKLQQRLVELLGWYSPLDEMSLSSQVYPVEVNEFQLQLIRHSTQNIPNTL